MGIAGNSLCWKCKKEEGTYLHMIWECSLVQPFWRKILRIFEEWLGFNLPVKPQLRLLGDKSVVLVWQKMKWNFTKFSFIQKMHLPLLRLVVSQLPGWSYAIVNAPKHPWFERLDWWNYWNCIIWVHVGKIAVWGKHEKNMGSFLATYKNGVMSRTS